MSTKEEDHLKFLFELDEGFCALPTFAVLRGKTQTDFFGGVKSLKDIDRTQVYLYSQIKLKLIY